MAPSKVGQWQKTFRLPKINFIIKIRGGSWLLTWARVEHSVKMRLEVSSNLDFMNVLELAVHAI